MAHNNSHPCQDIKGSMTPWWVSQKVTLLSVRLEFEPQAWQVLWLMGCVHVRPPPCFTFFFKSCLQGDAAAVFDMRGSPQQVRNSRTGVGVIGGLWLLDGSPFLCPGITTSRLYYVTTSFVIGASFACTVFPTCLYRVD
jgi:hypothetical protein